MPLARRAFSTVDMVALIGILVVVGLITTIVMMALRGPRTAGATARRMQSATQVRGIHQSMLLFAGTNNGWCPGVDSNGNGAPRVEEVYRLLLDGNFFTAEYMISPADTRTTWTSGTVTSANYSYAMLQINPGASFEPAVGVSPGSPFARRKEWRDTTNAEAAVLADRNTGTAAAPTSIHDATAWRGSVAYNDNHADFVATHILPRTQYSGVVTMDDLLFDAAGDDDALMIFEGTEK